MRPRRDSYNGCVVEGEVAEAGAEVSVARAASPLVSVVMGMEMMRAMSRPVQEPEALCRRGRLRLSRERRVMAVSIAGLYLLAAG